ncbi:MAG: hypothetical protein IRY99_20115 [Isosphaeraceae bacterium]|nr:hypothetical protein [Isosphaeraceae bacterium]
MQRNASRRIVPLLSVTAAVLALGWGCSGKPPVSSSTEEATVTGKVFIKGKPATGGKVVFDPANYQRKDVTARTADIQKDGTYTIKTLVGGNMVRVDSPEAAAAGGSYATINYDVKSGENQFDIKIPPEG